MHLSGTVEWIKDPADLKRVQQMYRPEVPAGAQVLQRSYGVTIDIIPFLKITPKSIDYLDYSKGFNHWDTLAL